MSQQYDDLPRDDQQRLDTLLVRMLETGLSSGEHQELNERLRNSLAARRYFMQFLYVDARLAWDHAQRQSEGGLAQFADKFRTAIESQGGPPASDRTAVTARGNESNWRVSPQPEHRALTPPGVAASGSPAVRRPATRATGVRGLWQDFLEQPAALAILLLVLVSGGALLWGLATLNPRPMAQRQPPTGDPSPLPVFPNSKSQIPDRPIARLRGVAHAAWDGTAWNVGSELRAGQRLVLKAGLAEVAFESGASVILEGPAELEIGSRKSEVGNRNLPTSDLQTPTSANACSLTLGKLVALVPTQARGFAVATPDMTIVDLGTEFGVEVTSEIGGRRSAQAVNDPTPDLRTPTSTSVQVFQGEVELTPIADVAHADRPPTSDLRPPILLKAGEALVSQPRAAPRIVRVEPARYVRALPAEEPGASARRLMPGDILAVCRSTLKLVKIDPQTGQQTLLVQGDRKRHGREWMCVAVDAQHRVYVGTEANRAVGGGQVLRIDPQDGSIAVVASSGLMAGGRIISLAVSADGTLLAAQDGLKDQILSIHPETGDASSVVEYGDNAWSIALDTGGRDFFIVSDGGPSGLARYADGQLTSWLSYKDPRNYRSVAVTPDGRVFVSYVHLEERNIAEVDRRTHELRPIVTLPAAQAPLGQVAVEANGHLIVGSYALKGEVFRIDAVNKTAQLLAEDGQLQASGGVAVVPSR